MPASTSMRSRFSASAMAATHAPARRSGRRAPVHSADMTTDRGTDPSRADSATGSIGTGAWVVLPTYDEAENLPGIAFAILAALPGATLLVVDDNSPDGTGRIADRLAKTEPRIRVRHRPGKQGIGRAYLDGFRVALDAGAIVVCQMDADWSHDPTALPRLLAPIAQDAADLVIGSRYVKGGKVLDWGIGRRLISRGGSLFARTVLGLRPHDLTGGFKAWRASTLAGIPFDGVHAGGYVFQIEMTQRAARAGARVVEVHLPGPARGTLEDVAPHHRRGAARRRAPALG
jgi:dolichol-phosphate mannosyltransferase